MDDDFDYLEHTMTPEIVCPYCLYEYSDSWEFTKDFGEEECTNCGKTFSYSRYVEVSYSTRQTQENKE